MTDEQKKKYVEQGGVNCPCCGSKDIGTETALRSDAGTVWQDVKCNSCGELWIDKYDLVDVEDL